MTSTTQHGAPGSETLDPGSNWDYYEAHPRAGAVARSTMSPVLVAGIAAGALLLGGLIGYLIARARHDRAMERLAGDLQNSVGLYLRRKVAEAGLDPGEAVRAVGNPESVLRANGSLAATLLQQERRQVELGDTQELGLARTMRLKSTSELEPVSDQDAQKNLEG